MLAIRMKRHVPRAGTGGNRRERHLVRTERAGSQIEIQRVDLVGAEIDAEHMLRIEVGEDLVRVRAFLPRWIGTRAIAHALEQIASRSEATAGHDRNDGEDSASEMGGAH